MQERRILMGSREDLSSWGTWKTGYELQQGDVIYGIACRMYDATHARIASEVELSTNTSLIRDLKFIQLNPSIYNTLGGRACFGIYSNLVDRGWQRSDEYEFLSNGTQLTGYYSYIFSLTLAFLYRWNDSEGYYWYDCGLDNSTYGSVNWLPNLYIPGFYSFRYFGNNMKLIIGKDDVNYEYNRIIATDVYIYYDGGANTFTEGDEDLLFLTSDIPQD